jgi:recombination protein RecT
MADETESKPKRPPYELMAVSAKDAFLQVMDEKKWSTEIMFAMQVLRGNELLQKADQQSIKNAIVNVALTGTTLNPAKGMAYLVPRDGKCCLDLSYRGLAGIAMDSGSVKHIAPKLVYTFDKFEYKEIDGEAHIVHEKNFSPPEDFCKGPEKFWEYIVCGYVVAILHDGTKIITEPLPKWKLEKAMKTSKTSSGKTPWRTHPDEMCLKTLVKHSYKLLPQTDRMAEAVAILNEHEGLADRVSHAQNIMSKFADAEDAVMDRSDTTTGNPKDSGAVTEATLQLAYKVLDGLSSISGDSPDAIVSRLTGGKVTAQIDLEMKPENYVKDIILQVQAEIEKGA